MVINMILVLARCLMGLPIEMKQDHAEGLREKDNGEGIQPESHQAGKIDEGELTICSKQLEQDDREGWWVVVQLICFTPSCIYPLNVK